MTIFDATQVLLQAPWAHCFARTPFPVLYVLRASCLLSLNLFTFALINEELKKGVFRAMGSGDVDPFTSTCLQGTHPSPARGPWSNPVTTLKFQVADSGVPLVGPGHLDKIVVVYASTQ